MTDRDMMEALRATGLFQGFSTNALTSLARAAEADQIALVADARADSALTAVDATVAQVRHGAPWEPRVWLFLAHPSDTRAPSGTAAWLRRRDVDMHVHARVGHVDDIGRLARMLADRAVGLALSGGAARGYAHIGVYRAWCEAGLPVDCLAGTSAGALLGGMMAHGRSPGAITLMVETIFGGTANPFGDVTLPLMALIRGHRLRRILLDAYGDTRIEDLWIPFFVPCLMVRIVGAWHPRHRSPGRRRSCACRRARPRWP